MKYRVLLASVILACLVIVACGKKEDASKPASARYEATLAEGIQFDTKPDYPVFIESVTGMSGYEKTGRWTEGPKVVFAFAQPLPTNFTLKIEIAGVFGPNTDKAVKVQVGDWHGEFVPGVKPKRYDLMVKTKAPSDSIELTVPEPKSPKELGVSDDPRQVGIHFKRLSITTP